MMKKVLRMSCGVFAALSALNLMGILKMGVWHEPKPPHLRGE
ncbi:hypothetical protein [Brevibacillus sp. SYP-B805]|nr:hypothetical protein [Brevibacillus sp. SYP-B805]